MERFPENKNEAPCPVYEIDLTRAWNSEAEYSLFLEGLRKLPFYRSGLLYSGFDGDHIGISFTSQDEYVEDGIFCCNEADLSGTTNRQNAVDFAIEYKNSAIAVYDSSRMTRVEGESDAYRTQDSSALIAIIKIKK